MTKILNEADLRVFVRTKSPADCPTEVLVVGPVSYLLNSALVGIDQLKHVDNAATAKSLGVTMGASVLGGPVGIALALTGLVGNYFLFRARSDPLRELPLLTEAKELRDLGYKKWDFKDDILSLKRRSTQ